MLRIINLTNKTIPISKNAEIRPHSYLEVQCEIDSRLYQLMNMGLIKIQQVNEKDNITQNKMTSGMLRRKMAMENIKQGKIKPSTALDVLTREQETKQENKSNKSKKRKNK